MEIKKLLKKLRLLTIARKEPYFLLRALLGFSPVEMKYYELALLHKSSSIKDDEGRMMNNERLEFLGDAVLEAVVSDILYKKFEGKKEGFLTNTRSKIVQRETLNRLAVDMALDKMMKISTRSHSHNLNIYGNAFEALIGAIYLDSGYEKCHYFIEKIVFGRYLDINKLAVKEINFKSKLIEWGQKNKASVEFQLLEEKLDNEKNPIFNTQVLINNIIAGCGDGYSKRESQQVAAKLALSKIKNDRALFLEKKENIINAEEEVNS